jgi:hypothetical protein
MSRKGLLPEADFYCDCPYTPLRFCTDDATDGLIERGSTGLLEEVFELFKRETAACDPDYAAKIGLAPLTIETFAPAYFAAREATNPFVWAASNLAEAEQNKRDRYTVQWRYAVLRMHEVIACAVPYHSIIQAASALSAFPVPRFRRAVFRCSFYFFDEDQCLITAEFNVVFQRGPRQRTMVVANTQKAAETQNGIEYF